MAVQISVRNRLKSIGFTGALPSDALSFPKSQMLHPSVRCSLRAALSGTESFGWPGLSSHHGWSTTKYPEVHIKVDLSGVSQTAYSEWMLAGPFAPDLAQMLASLPVAVAAPVLTATIRDPNEMMDFSSFAGWASACPSPGHVVYAVSSVWCEDWQGITWDGQSWYCSQTMGIRKLADISAPMGQPTIGAAEGSKWTPNGLLSMIRQVSTKQEAEGWLSSGWFWETKSMDQENPEGEQRLNAPGYTHIGDVDWVSSSKLAAMNPKWNQAGSHQGYVFAPLEEDGRKRPTGMVAAFFDNMEDNASDQGPVFRWGSSPFLHAFDETTLSVDGVLRPQRSLPWCAVNPWDGLLYTSAFDPPYDAAGDVSYLYRYDIHHRTDLSFQQLRELRFPYHVAGFLQSMLSIGGSTASFSLPVYTFAGVFPVKGHLTRIQGGCFSQDGSLFLASDATKHPGIWRMSMLNGCVLDRVGIYREYSHENLYYNQEVEGVCIHGGGIINDLPRIVSGVWEWNPPAWSDYVFLKHRLL